MFPLAWRQRLRKAKASGATYDLAIAILTELFKVEQFAVKEIILSEEKTGLPERTRQRAIKDLVQLNLIKVQRHKGQAFRIAQLFYL
jgi:hypothetical protein